MRPRRQWPSCLVLMAIIVLPVLASVRQIQAHVGVDTAGSANTTPALILPEVVIAPGTDVVLDLKLSNNPGNVRGVDLTLAYTPALVELRSVAKGPLAADWMLVSNAHPNGLTDIALAGVAPPAGDVVLARLTFRGTGQKGQASAIAFRRALINEADVSAAAQDGLITIDTPPVTDLAATVSGGAVLLTWTHMGNDADHYEVWRATNLPYFSPPEGALIAPHVDPGSGTNCSDPNSGLGNPAANSFYLVRSIDAAGRPAPTYNRVGIFSLAIQPGASQ